MNLDRAATFPWPFAADLYRYSANLEAAPRRQPTAAGAWGGTLVDVNRDYADELAQRAAVLARDPGRCAELPHMRPAAWDALLTILRTLAAEDPARMHLHEDGDQVDWRNDVLGVHRAFTVGRDDTLPEGPLRLLGTQVPDDIVLLDPREGTFWVDAGLVTFASNWSFAFNTGMSFMEIHGPVPRDHADGAIPRALQFLLRLQPGQAFRRLNWSTTVGRRLDTSLETYADWGHDRAQVLGDPDFGARMHLRVEVQHLIRLPETGALMFLIRTYLLSLAEIARVPEWRTRFAAVLRTLPAEIADYKSLTRLRIPMADWLDRASPGQSIDAACRS